METKYLQLQISIELHDALLKLAKLDHRSKSAEALTMLEESISGRLPKIASLGTSEDLE